MIYSSGPPADLFSYTHFFFFTWCFHNFKSHRASIECSSWDNSPMWKTSQRGIPPWWKLLCFWRKAPLLDMNWPLQQTRLLHLRTETYLCSDLWSISLWKPCFPFLPLIPLFNLFLLLYLLAYFPPVVSPRLCLSLLVFLGFLPTSLLPNWISCRWSIWRGRGRATTAWEKHRLSSGRSTRGGTCCSPDSRCRSLPLLLLINRLWHLWWELLMHSRDNNRLVSCYYLISLLLYDSKLNITGLRTKHDNRLETHRLTFFHFLTHSGPNIWLEMIDNENNRNISSHAADMLPFSSFTCIYSQNVFSVISVLWCVSRVREINSRSKTGAQTN